MDQMGLKYEAGEQARKQAAAARSLAPMGFGVVAAAAHFYGFPSSHYNMKGISHTLTLGESHVCFWAGRRLRRRSVGSPLPLQMEPSASNYTAACNLTIIKALN